MSIRTLHFKQMLISAIEYKPDNVSIQFDEAIIIKNMEAAEQETRWRGSGVIRLQALSNKINDLPDFPSRLIGADIKDNQLTYRDEVAIPFEYHGSVGIRLNFDQFPDIVSFVAQRMSLTLTGHEKYIEHIKAG